MKLTALSVDGFKNLKGVSLIPDPSYNLILGENAQGKTNLLEAIWTLTGCRSFRGTRERDYLPFSGGNLQVEAKFQDARREQSVRLCMVSGTVPEKKIWCNDVPQKSSALFSVFHCVTFTPEDLSLVEGGAAVSAGVAAAKCCAETTAAGGTGGRTSGDLGQTAGTAGYRDRRPAGHLRPAAGGSLRAAVRPDRTGTGNRFPSLSVQRVRKRRTGHPAGKADTGTGAAVRRKNAAEPQL